MGEDVIDQLGKDSPCRALKFGSVRPSMAGTHESGGQAGRKVFVTHILADTRDLDQRRVTSPVGFCRGIRWPRRQHFDLSREMVEEAHPI